MKLKHAVMGMSSFVPPLDPKISGKALRSTRRRRDSESEHEALLEPKMLAEVHRFCKGP